MTLMSKSTQAQFVSANMAHLQKYFLGSESKVANDTRKSPVGMVKLERGALHEFLQIIASFEISRLATTKKEWRNVFWWAIENDYEISRGDADSDLHPITQISKYDALKWCNAKSEMNNLQPCYRLDGAVFKNQIISKIRFAEDIIEYDILANGYRIPTEFEWTWAAYGGHMSKGYVYAGSNDLDSVAWFNSNSKNATHQCGKKRPNELGIYDMSGNIWEWCWDSGTFPISCLGGSWSTSDEYCQICPPEYHSPAYHADNQTGFRYVRSLEMLPYNGRPLKMLSVSNINELEQTLKMNSKKR